jgi:hypothetical protein
MKNTETFQGAFALLSHIGWDTAPAILGRALSRRAALAGGLALVPAALPAIGGDAELLELGEKLKTAWEIEKPFWAAEDAWVAAAVDVEPPFKAAREACSCGDVPACCAECAQDDTWEIIFEIAALPACTLAGVRVKAAAIRYIYDESPDDDSEVGNELRSQIVEFLAPEAPAA